MTDKELRKLKRVELIEILFYQQKEIDSLKQENESLKLKVDELNKSAFNSHQGGISQEDLQKIIDTIKSTTSDCLSKFDNNTTNETEH